MRRTLTVLLVAAGVAGALPSSAAALSGSPAAKRLARQVLAAYKRVDAVRTRASGSVYYCADVRGGYLTQPGPGCNGKATVTYTRVLRRGRVTGGFGRTTASGRTPISFISRSDGTFHRRRGATCWTRVDSEPRFSGPAFGFLPAVRLRITRSTRRTLVLRGDMPGFRELLTIRKATKLITREELVEEGRRVVYKHTNLSRRPALPEPKPAC